MKYNPALDGIRAVAVTTVVADHCGLPMSNAQAGVETFFVLSGFLITTILMEDVDRTGRISLGRFYLNRAIRLCPPLFMMLGAFVILSPVLFPGQEFTRSILAAALYLTDFERGFGLGTTPLAHTWSLAVEEHYYFLWPLVLPFFARMERRRAFRLLIAIFIAATAWRIVAILGLHDLRGAYYRFDGRMSGLVLGSALAFLPWRPASEATGAIALAAVVVGSMLFKSAPLLLLAFWFTVLQIAAAFLILSVDGRKTSAFKFLSWRPLVYLGWLSYSIYVWHYPIAEALRGRIDSASLTAVVVGVTLAIAVISWHMVEKPLKMARHSRSARLAVPH